MSQRSALVGTVTQWIFLLLLGLFPAAHIHAGEPLRLIAHRGGVVDGHHPENSAGAVQEAIRRG